MKTKIRSVKTTLALLALMCTMHLAQAFYMAEAGRWINRDPIGERAGINLYQMVGNQVTINVDRFGHFGAGFSGGGRYWGHGDMPGSGYFDYNKEDNDISTCPWPIVGSPGNHFQSYNDSAGQVQNAINSCSAPDFQRAMHRLQDSFSHYGQGYRWQPFNVTLPCWGFGHGCVGTLPDQNEDAFWAAFDDAQKWMTKWHVNCCQNKCGNWSPRSSGKCAQ